MHHQLPFGSLVAVAEATLTNGWNWGDENGQRSGVMFDITDDRPRQSLTVFAGEIRGMLPDDAARQDRKLIQTAVHEIGHALNPAHRFEREVGHADSTSSMNYDWRYLGGQRVTKFWNRFSYSVDADELTFLRHASYPVIVMGGAHFHSARYWYEADGGYIPYVPEHPLPGIALHVSITLDNRTGRPLRLPASVLDPTAGFVEILVRRLAHRRSSSDAPESFHPALTRCSRSVRTEQSRLRRAATMRTISI